jgi:LysR family transcriptional regulator, flagellar master operon regulator
MNTEQARTFLEVAATGNFIRAADRLHVTQSTVSARIKALEESLGQRLFERDKAGARLTAAGRQFQRHAENMVRSWQQARHELALPSGYRGVLSLGVQTGLWSGIALAWIDWLSRHEPELAIRTSIGSAADLTRHVLEGTLDLAILHDAQPRRGLEVVPYRDEIMALVSHQPRELVRWDPLYVYVDWGDSFRDQHTRAYPVDETPSLTVTDGSTGLAYILENGGSGYFPVSMVAELIGAGRLFAVPEAPIFSFPLFAVLTPSLAAQPWFSAAADQTPRGTSPRFVPTG